MEASATAVGDASVAEEPASKVVAWRRTGLGWRRTSASSADVSGDSKELGSQLDVIQKGLAAAADASREVWCSSYRRLRRVLADFYW